MRLNFSIRIQTSPYKPRKKSSYSVPIPEFEEALGSTEKPKTMTPRVTFTTNTNFKNKTAATTRTLKKGV